MEKVEVGGVETEYTFELQDVTWILFKATKNKSYGIYIKANTTIENCYGGFGG